jgi:hypothetical protein
MSKYIHSALEPRLIGDFDVAKAQRFSKRYHRKLHPSRGYETFSPATTRKLMRKFDADLWGLNREEQKYFSGNAHSWVEDVVSRQNDPDDTTNLWHMDKNDAHAPTSFDIGSSSHPTDIVCGDVEFDFELSSMVDFKRRLQTPLAQLAVNEALERGDAWLYGPALPLEGKIVRFSDPNIHRKSHGQPPYIDRFIVRAPHIGS